METIVSEQVSHDITSLIIECIEQDKKLPTEQEMINQFQISRTALREILNSYAVNGIITSQQGSGRYAHYPDLGIQIKNVWFPFIKHKPSMMLDFFEIRKCLEISSLPVVMNNLRPDDLLQLRKHANAMVKCAREGKTFEKHDRDFHCALFACTGNPLFTQLLTAFWDVCESAFTWPENNDLMSVAQQHVDILEALACQDKQRASELLEQQFIESRNQIALAMVKIK
ncbi:MAG: FadR/GntR family transcriptional regulator [Suipraeoptans sp.]